jgi:hypothetical protein
LQSAVIRTEQLHKILSNLRWLPAYGWQAVFRRLAPSAIPLHLIIAVADHFEPSMTHNGKYADPAEQERRLNEWCRDYPKMASRYVDADGCCLRHTYFYPAEQHSRDLVDRLAEHCHQGWGEIEIHLHHGIQEPDNAENTRKTLVQFRDYLAAHGCLARFQGETIPRYAFVHGNWALANSGNGYACGVDDEMKILAETGCYADFTLPSAPHKTQISKINRLYECTLPLYEAAPHRRGRNLTVGRSPAIFPLIVQGPLMLDFSHMSPRNPLPRIENAGITAKNPPTIDRLQLWKQAGIIVSGQPNWIFVKLHCHGLDPREQAAMTGAPISNFLHDLLVNARNCGYQVHYVTAREMVNIILAACEGYNGNPGKYRNHRLKLMRSV